VLCFNSGLQSGQPVSDPTIGVNSLISAAAKSICLYPPSRGGDLEFKYGHRRLKSQICRQHPPALISIGTTARKSQSYDLILSCKKWT
jgi:hypothetical protein